MSQSKLETFIKLANIAHSNKYDYSKVVYTKAHDKIIIICPVHGEFNQSLIDHRNGRGCFKCANKIAVLSRQTPKVGESLLDKFPELCKEWSDKNESRPEDYTFGSNKKVLWKCSKCDNEWIASIKHRKENVNCPKCNSSKGEKKIQEELNNLRVSYKVQYRDKECRDKLPLSFDFAILNNGEIIGLIEYQGIQHYETNTGIFNCPKKFETVKSHDKIKFEYCQQKKIPLLIIPYTEKENIPYLVKIFLEGLGIPST